MSEAFRQSFAVRWSDLDPNHHVKHSSYLDLCATARFFYLESLGFGTDFFQRESLGPILFSEFIQYKAEVRANDRIVVSVQLAGLSKDGRKFKIIHDIHRQSDMNLAATLEVHGAWFDLKERKLRVPPEALQKAMSKVSRTENFQVLP